MEPLEVGLRERKRAKQKVMIMDALLEALKHRELSEIKVEDLCRGLDISKVTFFNYFSSKEQVLEYFVHKWEYESLAMIQKEGLSGKEALYCIFDSIGNHPAGANIMAAVMLFFLKHKDYVPMHISQYEYFLFNTEAAAHGWPPVDLAGLFSRALGDFVDKPEDKKRMVNYLIVGFYGVPLVDRLGGRKDLSSAYRDFIDLSLSVLSGYRS